MLCHLSALAGYIIPFGNVLGPLIIWQIKKNEFPSVEEHGKAALNFQITVLIGVLIGIIAAVLLSAVCIGFLFIPVVVAIGLCGLIFARRSPRSRVGDTPIRHETRASSCFVPVRLSAFAGSDVFVGSSDHRSGSGGSRR